MFESLPPSGWPISSPLLVCQNLSYRISLERKKVFVLLLLFYRAYGGGPDGEELFQFRLQGHHILH